MVILIKIIYAQENYKKTIFQSSKIALTNYNQCDIIQILLNTEAFYYEKYIKAAGVFLTLIIVCLSFVGCKGNSNPIAGKWLVYKDSGGEAWVDFKEDGTFHGETMDSTGKGSVDFEGTYTVSDNNLTLYKKDSNENEIYTWSIANDTLSLTNKSSTITLPRYGTSSVGEVSNSIVDNAKKSSLKADAASLDNACKDYYACIVSGIINTKNPENVTYDTLPEINDSTSSRRSKAKNCTVYGAMQYSGLISLESRLSEFCYDKDGRIYANADDTKPADTNALTKDTTLGKMYNK